jgi:hypothetical protein
MVDAEGRGDGTDSPVLAEIEAANFRVVFGRDQGTPPGTRDGRASAVEGATRFGGRRPYIATRPPGTRSANPSACRAGVCATPGRDGKSDPSRARDRAAAREPTTGRRAVRVPAIARHTNRERAVTEPTDLVAKGYVHVGAAAHSDWTAGRNRDTTSSDLPRSVGASRRPPRVWRG